ncbi:MAG: hypothetical protein NC320_01655 [Clostridium sp.]|nr:hypothetical protein [Clostridium sp.]
MFIKLNEDNSIDSIITVGLPNEEDKYIEVGDITDDIKKNIFCYKYINGEFVLKDNADEIQLRRIRNAKINAMSNICHNIIIHGFDFEDGHHYSLKESDQNSLNVLSLKAAQGLNTAWHYDGGYIRFYTPEEMLKLTGHAFRFITYHQTYFNQLKAMINNMDNLDDIIAVQYGIELTGVYAENLERITDGFKPPVELIQDLIDYDRLLNGWI